MLLELPISQNSLQYPWSWSYRESIPQCRTAIEFLAIKLCQEFQILLRRYPSYLGELISLQVNTMKPSTPIDPMHMSETSRTAGIRRVICYTKWRKKPPFLPTNGGSVAVSKVAIVAPYAPDYGLGRAFVFLLECAYLVRVHPNDCGANYRSMADGGEGISGIRVLDNRHQGYQSCLFRTLFGLAAEGHSSHRSQEVQSQFQSQLQRGAKVSAIFQV